MPPAANTDWERLISLFGLPLILLVLIGLAAWKFVRWCRPHVERVITAHVGLLQTCSATLLKLESNSTQSTDKIDKLAEHTLDPRGPCQRSNMALVSASHAFDAIAKHDPTVQEHTDKMRMTLLEG